MAPSRRDGRVEATDGETDAGKASPGSGPPPEPLGEDPPDEAVSLGGACAAVWLGAFFGSQANAGPRTELRCGRKGGRVGTHFSYNLLRPIYQESRPLCD